MLSGRSGDNCQVAKEHFTRALLNVRPSVSLTDRLLYDQMAKRGLDMSVSLWERPCWRRVERKPVGVIFIVILNSSLFKALFVRVERWFRQIFVLNSNENFWYVCLASGWRYKIMKIVCVWDGFQRGYFWYLFRNN